MSVAVIANGPCSRLDERNALYIKRQQKKLIESIVREWRYRKRAKIVRYIILHPLTENKCFAIRSFLP